MKSQKAGSLKQGLTPQMPEVFRVLRAWLLDILPDGVSVLQARQDDTPPPAGDYILLSAEAIQALCQPSRAYQDGLITTSHMMRIDITLTISGDAAAEITQLIVAQYLQGSSLGWFRSQHPAVSPLDLGLTERMTRPSDGSGYVPCWRQTLQLQVTQSAASAVETALSAHIKVSEIDDAEQ